MGLLCGGEGDFREEEDGEHLPDDHCHYDKECDHSVAFEEIKPMLEFMFI